jgi:microcystin degradation protein MlrC
VRIAALGFYHESNTFVEEPTRLERFEETAWLHGDDIVRVEGDAHSSMAGFLAIGEQEGVDVVPLFFARATPSGTIAAAAFERIAAELCAPLEREGPWDAVLLVLHSAAVSESYPDADGEIAARVRAVVGERVPIGLALDMHGNLTSRLLESATVTTMYRTNPHVDARERALECADIVVRAVRGEVRPVQALVQVPAAINILQQFTGEEPMRGIMADAEALIGRDGILTVSVAEGYPYADVAEMGMAVIAVHDGSATAAAAAVEGVAERLWARRAEFVATAIPVDEALRRADEAARGPVLLLDTGDNIGGGSPGDSTALLEAAIRLGIRGLLTIQFDPEAVADCAAAGAGSTVTLPVGGRSGTPSIRPVEVTGTVRLVADGTFEEPTPTHGGFRHFDPGQSAVLETTHGHTIVLMSKLVPPVSLEQLLALDIDPRSFRMIVAKGVQSPRAAYEPICSQLIMVASPGVTAADLDLFTYASRRRPLFPFEEVPGYRPEALTFGG